MFSANRGSLSLWWLLVMLVVLSLLGLALHIGENCREQEREAFQTAARRYAVESGLNWALSYTHRHGVPKQTENHLLEIDAGQQVRVQRKPLSATEVHLESQAASGEIALTLQVTAERQGDGDYEVKITGALW